MSITPNMNLLLPTPTTTAGPLYATQNTTALTLIDAHDHTPGRGKLVPASGIGINGPLPFNGYDATGLRSVRLASQTTALSVATDLGAVFNLAGELYYRDGSGNSVQITSNGALAGAAGTISGLPNGTAGAAYASGSGSFVFTQATSTGAIMDGGPVIIRDTAANAKGITLKSPASLAADYNLTLPAALPGSGGIGEPRLMFFTAGGRMSTDYEIDDTTLERDPSSLTVRVKDLGINTAKLADAAVTTAKLGSASVTTAKIADANVTTAKLADASVTRAKMAAVGQQISNSSGSFSSASASFVAVTNLAVTLTTTGRPVAVMLQHDGGATASDLLVQASGGSNPTGYVKIVVSGSATADIGHVTVQAFASGGYISVPVSSVVALYAAPAGTYTFAVYVASFSTATTVHVTNTKLVAWEL